MRVTRDLTGRGILRSGLLLFAFAGVYMDVSAQTAETKVKTTPAKLRAETYDTLYVTNLTKQNDLNDIIATMRNMLPSAKIYGMPSHRSISLWATPEEIALARRILAELDHKKSSYRLTYTLTEMDGGKRVGSRDVAMVVIAGEKAQLKLGKKVPIVTGPNQKESAASDTQVQYIDVGLMVEANLDGARDNIQMRTKVEQSSIAEQASVVGTQDPVFSQTVLEATSMLVPGKHVVLGTVDMPGSSRHEEVEVVAELLPQ